jgi:Lar family restriction alleviation protein
MAAPLETAKSCPFCGSHSHTVLVVLKLPWGCYRRVECRGCQASGPEKIGRKRAIEAWNKRAPTIDRTKP